jgi:hypothetical protein
MTGQRPGLAKRRSDRDPTNRTETWLSRVTIGQMSKSQSRRKLLGPTSRGNQIGEWRSIDDRRSFGHKKEIKATRHSSQKEIHASEKIRAARASEVDRLMALARGLGPRSLVARPDKTATDKHWRRKNSDRSHERENLKLGRVITLLGRQNRR